MRSDITRPLREDWAEHQADVAEMREAARQKARAAADAHVERTSQARERIGDRLAGRGEAEAGGRADRLELSQHARMLAESALEEASRDEASSARRARVEELRRAYEAGELDTPDRIERAAVRILGDG